MNTIYIVKVVGLMSLVPSALNSKKTIALQLNVQYTNIFGKKAQP